MKTSKKVWIITRRAGYNFGSSLQAYAMQRIVNKLGFDNQIINYDEYSRFFYWKIRPFMEDMLFKILQFIPIFSRLVPASKYAYLLNRAVQIQKFELFEKKHLNLTLTKYRSSNSLSKDAFACDICICGSDQIWSPLLFDPTFYLDFCKNKKTKKIAYAPSFGINTIDQKQEKIRERIKELLLTFGHLSVRENEGASIIKDLIGKDVPVVFDPTLLLEKQDWEKLTGTDRKEEPYILCYFLGKDYIPLQFIESLKKDTGCRVINIFTFRTMNNVPGECVNTSSPSDFLSYIANASFVCTDSYHGTIFSTIFHRQFFTFERFKRDEKNSQNSRIYTLLSESPLKHRLFSIKDNYQTDTKPIDYSMVDKHFRQLKEISLNYLKSALSD